MYDEKHIENYALSLVKHGICSTIEEARNESERWHKKAEEGFVEPLKCAHRPDLIETVVHNDDGNITVTTTFPENEK